MLVDAVIATLHKICIEWWCYCRY